MKKPIVFFAAFCLLCIIPDYSLSAQKKNDDVIAFMQENLKQMVSAEVAFVFRVESSGGEKLSEESGFSIIQGDSFKMSTGSITVYCDGKTKWLYDLNAEEMTIFDHDPETRDFLENPFSALKRMGPEVFVYPSRSKMKVREDGRKVYVLELSPRKGSEPAGFQKIEMEIRADTYRPDRIVYMNVNGDIYFLDIVSLKSVPEKEMTLFRPDQSVLENEDLYITDMRS